MQYIGSELHDRMNLSGINLFALSEMILWMRKRLKRLKFCKWNNVGRGIVFDEKRYSLDKKCSWSS